MSFDDIDGIDDGEEHVDNTYLTFQVGGEEYAVPVLHVTEIVRLQKSYSLPDVPAYIRGVINLRGKVIPLLDVRSRFGLAEAAYTDRTVVVVLEVSEVATGLIVDGVSEVVEIPPEQIEAHSGLRREGRSSMVRGLGKRKERVSFILDVVPLLGLPNQSTQGVGAAVAASH
jgi:purine-binding chemotaxis protein CheW